MKQDKFSYEISIEETLTRKEADMVYEHLKAHRDTERYTEQGSFGFAFVNYYKDMDVSRCFSFREIDTMLKALEYPMENWTENYDVSLKYEIVRKLYSWADAIQKRYSQIRTVQDRPVISHGHTKGDWFLDENFKKDICVIDKHGNKSILFSCDRYNRHLDKYSLLVEKGKLSEEEKKSFKQNLLEMDKQDYANAKLAVLSPSLIQIAEAYFDSMKSRGEHGTMLYNIVLETLNSLK